VAAITYPTAEPTPGWSNANKVLPSSTVTTGGAVAIPELPFASLPAAPVVGTLANVSDSTLATVGSTVAGGGTNHVLARYSGTVWKVVA